MRLTNQQIRDRRDQLRTRHETEREASRQVIAQLTDDLRTTQRERDEFRTAALAMAVALLNAQQLTARRLPPQPAPPMHAEPDMDRCG